MGELVGSGKKGGGQGIPVTSWRKYTKKRSLDPASVWVCDGACMSVVKGKSDRENVRSIQDLSVAD